MIKKLLLKVRLTGVALQNGALMRSALIASESALNFVLREKGLGLVFIEKRAWANWLEILGGKLTKLLR